MPYIDNDAVLWKEVKDKVVVLRIATGTFCELNVLGSTIWKLLSEGKDRSTIISHLVTLYDVSHQQLSSDVDSFFERMIKEGLLNENPV